MQAGRGLVLARARAYHARHRPPPRQSLAHSDLTSLPDATAAADIRFVFSGGQKCQISIKCTIVMVFRQRSVPNISPLSVPQDRRVKTRQARVVSGVASTIHNGARARLLAGHVDGTDDAKAAGGPDGRDASAATAELPRPKVLQHTDARAHLELAQLTCLLHYYGTRAGTGKAGAGPEFLVSERPVRHWPTLPRS